MTQLTEPLVVTEFDRTTALMPLVDRPGELLVDLDAESFQTRLTAQR
jgi:hypothetical protein